MSRMGWEREDEIVLDAETAVMEPVMTRHAHCLFGQVGVRLGAGHGDPSTLPTLILLFRSKGFSIRKAGTTSDAVADDGSVAKYVRRQIKHAHKGHVVVHARGRHIALAGVRAGHRVVCIDTARAVSPTLSR